MPTPKLKLRGSCHCQAVTFELRSAHIFPYQRCYCSICRKTQGGGGYAINLSGDAHTLKVKGRKNISVYRAKSSGQRHFCSLCGSALWLYDPEWPDLIHPFASAIDSPLPVPPETTHLMLGSKASWVQPDFGPKDRRFRVYPKESIAAWHARLGLENRAKKRS